MGYKEKTGSTIKTYPLTAQPQHDKQRCIVCRQNSHPLYRCKEFIHLRPTNRLNLVQKQKLCVNCFNSNHVTNQCHTSGRCQKCGQRHNTLVHLEPIAQVNLVSLERSKETESTKESVILSDPATEAATSLVCTPVDEAESMAVSPVNTVPYVLLGTALAKVNANGLQTECKAILDSRSQANLITERLVTLLGLSAWATSIPISGINRTKIQHRANITLQSRLNQLETRLEAFVLPQIIAPQPDQQLTVDKWSSPNNIALADPTFNRPDKFDILLGAEYHHQLLAIGQIELADGLPMLQNTAFGWRVSGKVSGKQLSSATANVKTSNGLIKRAIHLPAPLPLESPLPTTDKKVLHTNPTPKQGSPPKGETKGTPPPKHGTLAATSMLTLVALLFPSIVC